MRPTTGPGSAPAANHVVGFIRALAFEALPLDVVTQAQRCLLDLIGVAAGGSRAPAATVINSYVVSQMASRDFGARLLLDGRRASVAGAALAGAAGDGHYLRRDESEKAAHHGDGYAEGSRADHCDIQGLDRRR